MRFDGNGRVGREATRRPMDGPTPSRAAEPATRAPGPESLAARTTTAARWRIGSSLAQGAIQFGVGIVLARLLPPRAFGVMALAAVVIGFATIVSDLGLSAAVIQRRALSESDIRVAFTANSLLGLGLGAVLAGSAPLATPLLNDEAFAGVLRALALTFVFAGFGATARALLQRRLEFRRLFYVDLLSYVMGYALFAVALALIGCGIWSLVGGALAQGLAGTVLAFGMVRHAVRPLLAWDKLRAMLGFGVGISLNDLLNYVARNGDNFVVGWWLGAPALGLYARAYNLMTLPVTYVSSAMSSVLFPAFSEIQAEPDRLGRAYLASIRVGTIVAAPAMAGLAVAAPHLIRGVYGDRWMGAVLPLQVLCAAGIFRAVYHHAGALTQASGQVYAEARRQMMYAALVVLGSLAGTLWGLVGVSVAVAAAILFMYVAMAQLSLTITGRSWGQFLAAQRAGIALGTLVGLVALALRALLERAGMGDLAILIGIMAGIAALSPLALLLLPPLTLPITLAVRQRMMAERLPGPLRDMLARTLHSTGVGTPQ